MSNQNQIINHSYFLFGKMTKILFNLGLQSINKFYSKIFFKNLHRVDHNLYLIYQKNGINIGFKTNYCGVNAFIPTELKKYWISDHHFLTMLYSFGHNFFSVIPYDGQLYTIRFNRIGVPSDINVDEIDYFQRLKDKYCLLDDLTSWIKLFSFNRDQRILNHQGMIYPEISKFDKGTFNDLIQFYKSYNNIRRISTAREKMINIFEHILASITIG